MVGSHDLYWVLSDWKYAEVTSIDISNGPVFNNIASTLTVDYRVNKSKCFVATACFGESDSTVVTLRNWRDNYLSKTPAGESLISLYDVIGPYCAAAVSRNRTLKLCTALILRRIAGQLNKARLKM
jgi:hypothetical protein